MKRLRILCVEDSLQDLTLLKLTLQRAKLDFELVHVMTIPSLIEQLDLDWDLIISDYHLAGFTAQDVMRTIAQHSRHSVSASVLDAVTTGAERTLLTPVIIVSGAVREEEAVDLMKLGAKDFVRKDNSVRLVPAILREWRDSEQRRARQSAERALRSSQEFTTRILQSTDDCIFILNSAGFVIRNSLGGGTRLHFAQDDSENLFFDLWTRNEDRALAQSAFFQAQVGEAGQFVGQQQSGNATYWWNVAITAIHESEPGEPQYLAIARDVSRELIAAQAVERQTAELKQALVQAESANQMKTSFLANMSHEIRTPIGAMMGFSELFLDPSVSEEERAGFLSIIKRNGETVLRLLNDILDLSKIEAGYLEIEKIPIPLEQVIREVVETLRPVAEKKGLSLQIESKYLPQEIVHTDPTRLKQILSNLINNSIKFTASGSVRLITERQNNKLLFWVRDTGIGIAPENQGKLFCTFIQGDNSLTRKFGGTGLGLALSKRLAQALGGDIRIYKSEPGVGSEFLVEVLAESVSETLNLSTQNYSQSTTVAANELRKPVTNSALLSTIATVDPIQKNARLKGVKILVVDDVADNRNLLRAALSARGAILHMLENGQEAVEMIPSIQVDIVLMDLQMPHLDGILATKILRARGCTIPIVAISAHAMDETKLNCENAGFDAYITKPIDFEVLERHLLQFLKNKE